MPAKRSSALIAAVLASLLLLQAQTTPPQAARTYTTPRQSELTQQFSDFLAIPNVAADPANLRKNAEFLVAQLKQRGAEAKLLTAPGLPATTPLVVWGEVKTPGARRTIVFYAHYDGQPLDPKEWTTPPFQPVLRSGLIEKDGQIIPLPPAGTAFNPEWRLYARSAGDDKAPIIAMLSAVDAIRAAGLALKSNIKFAFEGEEEAGSTNLEKILAANKDLFSGDVWLMCDGPVHQTRRPLIAFGARTVLQVDITV